MVWRLFKTPREHHLGVRCLEVSNHVFEEGSSNRLCAGLVNQLENVPDATTMLFLHAPGGESTQFAILEKADALVLLFRLVDESPIQVARVPVDCDRSTGCELRPQAVDLWTEASNRPELPVGGESGRSKERERDRGQVSEPRPDSRQPSQEVVQPKRQDHEGDRVKTTPSQSLEEPMSRVAIRKAIDAGVALDLGSFESRACHLDKQTTPSKGRIGQGIQRLTCGMHLALDQHVHRHRRIDRRQTITPFGLRELDIKATSWIRNELPLQMGEGTSRTIPVKEVLVEAYIFRGPTHRPKAERGFHTACRRQGVRSGQTLTSDSNPK